MTPNLAALILAGGQSSRMGQDKALLRWQGILLLQRVAQVAATCCPQVYLLTPWPQRYQPILTGNYVWLLESQPGQGPLAALTEGLQQIPQDWVLLLACDLPRLCPLQLQAWASRLSQVPPSTLALVPRQETGWEPLCGFYRRDSLAVLERFRQQGERSLQRWLYQAPVQPLFLDPEAAATLWNCNTPADLLASDRP